VPNTLTPIPVKMPIVEPKSGAINVFFRQAWESLRAMVASVPTVGVGVDLTDQTAAIAGTVLYTTPVAGLYRVTYYARKTVADGVSSSFGFVWHWTESAVPQTLNDVANTTDTTGAVSSASKLLQIDANTNVTFDMSYASNTPARMKFRLSVRIELVN
jgi:hypothetical protein